MTRIIFLLAVVLSFVTFSYTQEDPRVKVLLQEALRLYGDKQYVRALDLFKQVERISPENAVAKEYVVSTEKRISEWEMQGGEGDKPKDPTWDSLLKSKKNRDEFKTDANDIIAARKSLVERMRNRSTSTSNIVQIQDDKSGLKVVLFHDQLFLPGLQTFRDESLPILENVAQLIREKEDRTVTIVSQAHANSSDPYLLFPDAPVNDDSDPSLPQMKNSRSGLFQDIESTRALVLFTYLAQRSMGQFQATLKP
ncbi:MAG: hypothetical protein ACKVQC_05365 [Elusimicrobiota bacterium]